jgi:hypothetical protein
LSDGTFTAQDSYLTIKPKKDGTATFVGDRKVLEDVPYDMELYVMNEDDGSYSSVAFTSSEAKADDGWGNYRMAYTVQLEAGKTYVLTATQAIKLGFYGYTYTTYIASSDEYEVAETSYEVSTEGCESGAYNSLMLPADTTLGETTLVEVKSVYAAQITTISDGKVIGGSTYNNCMYLKTKDTVTDGVFDSTGDNVYTYLTITPKKSGTIILAAESYDDWSSDIDFYEQNDDKSYSKISSGISITNKNDDGSGSITVHLEKGKTYALTSTLEYYPLVIFGYTYTADTSGGDSDVDHDDL